MLLDFFYWFFFYGMFWPISLLLKLIIGFQSVFLEPENQLIGLTSVKDFQIGFTMSFIDVLRIFLIFQVIHYFWLLQRILMENLKCVLCDDFSILFWSEQILLEHSWSLLFPMFVLVFCFWSCICSLGGLKKVIV